MKRQFLFLLLTLLTLTTKAQKIIVTTLDGSHVELSIVSDSVKQKILHDFNGEQDNTLRKQWTSRTFRLLDKRLIIEFYDRQAVVVESSADIEKLKEVRF